MEMPDAIKKIWGLLTPEQQAEVTAEVGAEATATDAAAVEADSGPAKSDADIFAEHNLPGTPEALGCVCPACERVRGAAAVAA